MRGVYLAKFAPIVRIPMDPQHLHYRNSQAKDKHMIIQMLNLTLLTSDKLHCLCTILDQIPPLIICRGDGENI